MIRGRFSNAHRTHPTAPIHPIPNPALIPRQSKKKERKKKKEKKRDLFRIHSPHSDRSTTKPTHPAPAVPIQQYLPTNHHQRYQYQYPSSSGYSAYHQMRRQSRPQSPSTNATPNPGFSSRVASPTVPPQNRQSRISAGSHSLARGCARRADLQ